jgi:isoaspartyl peptidase/L-asparaginase-like protein (Ntn-hydrolase superfamily)
MTIAMIVHGGASPVPAEEADAYKHGCLAALQAGWAALERGGNACDAVEAAIRSFEDDETFNAARGGFLNADGEVQMDAAIMEGHDLRYGALAAAQGLRHPISVARQILAVGPLLLSGEGVTRFGEAHGAELCDPAELITKKTRQQWETTERELREQRQTKPGGSDGWLCGAGRRWHDRGRHLDWRGRPQPTRSGWRFSPGWLWLLCREHAWRLRHDRDR